MTGENFTAGTSLMSRQTVVWNMPKNQRCKTRKFLYSQCTMADLVLYFVSQFGKVCSYPSGLNIGS